MSERGDQKALECLAACFADSDRMVRQVALEASEQLLDNSLTSVLLVLQVLRNVCQVPYVCCRSEKYQQLLTASKRRRQSHM